MWIHTRLWLAVLGGFLPMLCGCSEEAGTGAQPTLYATNPSNVPTGDDSVAPGGPNPNPTNNAGATAPPGPVPDPMATDANMDMGMPGAMTDAGDPPDSGGMGDAGTMADAGGPMQQPVSSFPSVAVDDLLGGGGFTAVTETRTGPGSAYNLYYPEELGRDGVKHPVLTWGNGATTTPDQYPLLPALAQHGFVVIAARSSFVDGELLSDGLDWMLAQNDTAGSDFEGMLDPDRVAALGYSLGSLATFEIGTDPRLTTTVHISGGIMSGGNQSQATAVDVPTAYFCDKDETGPNCDSDFAVVDDNPTFYGRVPGAVHVDYMFNRTFIDRMNKPVIGWLRWQLMDDGMMAPMFEGASCLLCSDSAWEVQKKNMD